MIDQIKSDLDKFRNDYLEIPKVVGPEFKFKKLTQLIQNIILEKKQDKEKLDFLDSL